MKAYVIRLKNSKLSNVLALDAFNSALKFGLNALYFDGIEGRYADEILKKYGVTVEDSPVNKHPGTRGCLASHYSLWLKSIELSEPILILEHDGVVINDILPLIVDVKHACHLDPNNIYDPRYNEDVNSPSSLGIKDYIKMIRPNTLPSYVEDEKGAYFRGAYGYIITPEGSNKLVEFWKKNKPVAADLCISKEVLDIQISMSTRVRLHPYYNNSEIIMNMSTRKNPNL